MKSSALSFGFGRALLLIGAMTGLMFGTVVCADPEGTTPECIQDLNVVDAGDAGLQLVHDYELDNGCNPFAVCIRGGKAVNAEECCKNLTNKYEHDVCLYGYGAGPFPKQP